MKQREKQTEHQMESIYKEISVKLESSPVSTGRVDKKVLLHLYHEAYRSYEESVPRSSCED